MFRFGILVAVAGLVIWAIARRVEGVGGRPTGRGAPRREAPSWQQRGLRVFVGGLVIAWLGLLVVIGMLR